MYYVSSYVSPHLLKPLFLPTLSLCSSYPALHIVPASIRDVQIECSAKFRACRRFPSVAWRYVPLTFTSLICFCVVSLNVLQHGLCLYEVL